MGPVPDNGGGDGVSGNAEWVDAIVIATAAEAELLLIGQWVVDAGGTSRCLVNTHVGWPQRMWMSGGGRAYTCIEGAAYPLRLVDLEEGPDACPHRWGTTECGHCYRCGVVAGPVKDLDWHLTAVRDANGGEG